MGFEIAFCKPSDWPGWSVCPGKPALEEDEPDVPRGPTRAPLTEYLRNLTREVPESLRPCVQSLRARVASYKAAGATVSVMPEHKIDLSVVTGEKGARAVVDCVLIAEFKDHSILDVFDDGELPEPALEIYAIATYIQQSFLHQFTAVNLLRYEGGLIESHRKPDELYVFGAQVTEAAALALSLRADVTALSHLVPGEQCDTCRARERCPELAKALM